ncbi:maker664 [Drosophila busckii]|uniref:Maker664 n=1 Tax=Drosophila busckii TaxID=30019 RepID=A0A0M5IYG2_DROBS|nr:maker664 [Drosophila busckii]
MDQLCGSYAYNIIKPLLAYVKYMQNKLNDNNVDDLNNEVAQFKEQHSKLSDKLKQQSELIVVLKEFNAKLQQTNDNLLNNLNAALSKTEANELKSKAEIAVNSCVAQKPGVHAIQLHGLQPFEVLCSHNELAADAGWLVIQQRINGKEQFRRNWASYSAGFGSFDGDFFLGLQKIHQLTQSQRHELFIHVQASSGEFFYARYDDFKVGSEQELFELQSLGAYNGTARRDKLRDNEHQKFTTFDSDNDRNINRNCADLYYGGWWYNFCTACNLNGKYADLDISGLAWDGPLKMVQMLIRPLN